MNNEITKLLAEKEMAERDHLMQRLREEGIGIRHTRLHGTQMSVGVRQGWEPYSNARAREVLREFGCEFKLDIANAMGAVKR